MSDILIRSMDMPKAGEVFEVAEGITGKKYIRKPMSYDDWHELIFIRGHSDLIDRDETGYALMNAILGEPPDAHYPSWYAGIVNKMPAIITSDCV